MAAALQGSPIVNIHEQPMRDVSKGARFAGRAARLGGAAGMVELGAQYLVVPAGKTAYPRHSHRHNEELFVILDGRGEYRRGEERWAVKPGDVIAAPAGGVDTAHQLLNNSDADLKYLVVSTRHDPDVVEYPDSGKFAVASGVPAGQGLLSAKLSYIGRRETSLDYWDGEDIGEKE